MENKQMIADSIIENVRIHILEFIELEPNIQCPVEYEKKSFKHCDEFFTEPNFRNTRSNAKEQKC
jgi:hypothetical protein